MEICESKILIKFQYLRAKVNLHIFEDFSKTIKISPDTVLVLNLDPQLISINKYLCINLIFTYSTHIELKLCKSIWEYKIIKWS